MMCAVAQWKLQPVGLWFQGRAIQDSGSDAVSAGVGVAQRDDIMRSAKGDGHGQLGPGFRNARVQAQRLAGAGETHDPLDADAIHPAGRSGVPGPATATGMGGGGIHVRRHDIGFDLVAIGVRSGQGVIDRVQHREKVMRGVPVAKLGVGKDSPHRGMAVLTAVLAQARGVTLDVTRVEGRAIERRREQQGKTGVGAHEALRHRGHRSARPNGVGCARKDRPGLRDAVDLAFIRAFRAEQAAVVKGAAPVPFAIPAVLLDGLLDRSCVGPPAHGTGRVAGVGIGGHQVDGRDQKPAQPDAGPPAAFAHPVHPVVPVAGSDQGHAIFAGHFDGLIQPPGAVFEEGSGVFGHERLEEIVMRPGRHRRPLQEGDLYVQDPRIPGNGDVARDAVAKPDPVVRNTGAHALTGVWQPPVLHVALGELPGRGAQKVGARHLRPREGQRHAVLQLVTEAVGAAGLIKPGPRPDPAGERLVHEPAVQEDVHRAVGRADLDRAKERGPVVLHLGQERLGIGRAQPLDQMAGGRVAVGLADQEDERHRLAWAQGQAALQGSAGVEGRASGPGKWPALQASRRGK